VNRDASRLTDGGEGRGMTAGTESSMVRISSRMTFFSKRVFPILWFGFLAIFSAATLAASASPRRPPVWFLIPPVVLAVFGYFPMKVLVFDLADEVWDAGNELVVKNKGHEVRVQLSDVKNVSYTVLTNPQRVTLTLRQPTVFGSEITFAPPRVWIPFAKHPLVEDLIERIDVARGLRT